MDIQSQTLEALQSRLGYQFNQPACLTLALTHPSVGGGQHNQRLEFLGDAVLQLTVSEQLYLLYPCVPEGVLTRMRASLVSESSLCKFARSLGLGKCLLLGKGEEVNNGRNKPSILADALEAVLGAVFLDGGWQMARSTVLHLMKSAMLCASDDNTFVDYKTKLQELCQHRKQAIRYRLDGRSGPDHSPKYLVTVLVDNFAAGQGEGRSKKEAEQRAAQYALNNEQEFAQ